MLENINFVSLNNHINSFASDIEKYTYLTDLKKDLTRIIKCFQDYHFFDPRDLANPNYIIQGECSEYQQFLRKVLMKNSLVREDRRAFDNDKIFVEVKTKLRELERLFDFVVGELKYFNNNADDEVKKNDSEKSEYDMTENIKTELDKFQMTQVPEIQNNREYYRNLLKNSNSEGMLKEVLNKKKIKKCGKFDWSSSREELIEIFKMFFDVGIISKLTFDDKENIISKYFSIHSEEKKASIETPPSSELYSANMNFYR